MYSLASPGPGPNSSQFSRFAMNVPSPLQVFLGASFVQWKFEPPPKKKTCQKENEKQSDYVLFGGSWKS